SWYEAEARVCREHGVRLVDRSMSASALPNPEVLDGILGDLKSTSYPLLIHCNAGADRTGAVAALYRISVLGETRTSAMQELSPDFLHYRTFAPCMDTLVEAYEPSNDWLSRYAMAAMRPCRD